MQDQRVVVVGGTSGMGRGVADAARAAGAAVVIAGRRPINQRTPLEPPDQHAVVDATRDESVRALFDSEMWDFLDDEARQKLRDKVVAGFPVHRVGTPGDIGDAAVFLMTSPYVTGAVLEVTGGESLVDVL